MRKQALLVAGLVALLLVGLTPALAGASPHSQFCLWDFCDQPGCWWICL